MIRPIELESNISFVSFSLDKLSEIRLCETSQAYIDSLSSDPLALIICSQTYNGKARFTNELLAETLLPCAPMVKQDDVVRMIRIKVNLRRKRIYKYSSYHLFLASYGNRCEFECFWFI